MTGIPRLIHQTWHDANPPEDIGSPRSWREKNPGWAYRLWTDRDLRQFMGDEFPNLLPLYDSYERGVQRADLGRYCLLYRLGGLYADIDTVCLSPVEPIAGDGRVILCEEPREHAEPARVRRISRFYFNGTMASPPAAPFWEKVIGLCRLMAPRAHFDVLETTGPLLLSAAVEQWPDKSGLSLNSPHLFAPDTVHGAPVSEKPAGPHGHLRLSRHLWKGTWYKVHKDGLRARKRAWIRRARHLMTQPTPLTLAAAHRRVDRNLLHRSADASGEPQVAIFVPVRDGAVFLERNIGLLDRLDYPKDRLRVIYGEGESLDESAALIDDIVNRHAAGFGEIRRIEVRTGAAALPRARRWRAKWQYLRRGAIARARNALIAHGMDPHDDWILWLDVDVVDFPPDILRRLLAERQRVVAPHCVLKPGGPSFDLNTFLATSTPSKSEYAQHLKNGLFQPPPDYWHRRHLHDLRYLDRVPLHGVGGAMLLVDANIHRAGIGFPDRPYRDLIETEAFGMLARDFGIVPIGLPKLEIRHAPT
jgi:hypothetical protein